MVDHVTGPEHCRPSVRRVILTDRDIFEPGCQDRE
jgi:hypothetical protein